MQRLREALERGPEDGAGPYPETSVKLTASSALLLFTDGLVEDRHVSVATGLQRLADAFEGRPPATAEEACSEALRTMGRDTSHDDDIAVLALRARNLADRMGPGLGLPRAADPSRSAGSSCRRTRTRLPPRAGRSSYD